MPHFKNVIFDMDGLLVDTEPLHQRALNAFMQMAGMEHQFDRDEYGKIFTGRPVIENAEYMRERFSLVHTADEISQAHRTIFSELIADARNLLPMEGLQELLEWLDANNFQTAVASSSRPEHVELIVRNLGLLDSFRVLVGNDGTLKPKPAPDVYLLALEKLGAKPPETLALEDSISGVHAAHAAGLFVIAVPNEFTLHQDFSDADLVMQDLLQVKAFLSEEEYRGVAT
jgi:beta-phosphoglucomutase